MADLPPIEAKSSGDLRFIKSAAGEIVGIEEFEHVQPCSRSVPYHELWPRA